MDKVYDDRLVSRWWCPNTKRLIVRPKRVGKDCPLTREERITYAYKGLTATVIYMRTKTRPGLDLRECIDMVRSAANTTRGDGVYRWLIRKG